MRRLTKKNSPFASIHNSFLQLLSSFYGSWRYDRFTHSEYRNYGKEKYGLIEFMHKYSDYKIEGNSMFPTAITNKMRKFLGNIIKKIVLYLYEEKIEKDSEKSHVFTYEVRYASKAYKVFTKKEFDFIHEDILWKEILLYVINNTDDKLIEFYKSMEPLEFDNSDLCDLLQSLKGSVQKLQHTDHLDALYEGIENKKERLDFMELIGNSGVDLPDEDD